MTFIAISFILLYLPSCACQTVVANFDVILNASYLYRDVNVDTTSSASYIFIELDVATTSTPFLDLTTQFPPLTTNVTFYEETTSPFHIVETTSSVQHTLTINISFGKIVEKKISTEIVEKDIVVTEPANSCFLPIGTGAPSFCIEALENGTCVHCVPGFELDHVNNICLRCLSGYYKNEFVDKCTPCEAGKTTLNATGQDRCYACDVNTSTMGMQGSKYCYPCPMNSSAPKKGMAYCTCDRGRGGPLCELCPPGFYGSSAPLCQSCEAGKYSTGLGTWMECSLCSPGKYAMNQSSLECLDCPVGVYNPNMGKSDCFACFEHGFAPYTGMTYCFCKAGFVLLNRSICMPCGVGKYGFQGDSSGECMDCESGMYSLFLNATRCSQCALGTFNNKTGVSACETCPIHSTTLQEGRNHISDCICLPGSFLKEEECTLCPGGQFQTGMNSSGCVDCEPGTFSAYTGHTSCDECPLNTYNPVHGKTHCFVCKDSRYSITLERGSKDYLDCLCLPGSAARLDDGSCGPCEAGTYKTGTLPRTESCISCERGTFSTKIGSLGPCIQCPQGMYGSSHGGTECKACMTGATSQLGAKDSAECMCLPGSYLSGSECEPCHRGTYEYNYNRNNSCQFCSPGKYSTGQGSKACMVCGRGFYSDMEGSTSCKSCGDAVTTTTNRDDETSVWGCVCLPGSYFNLNEMICMQCPPGKYQTSSNLSYCVSCSRGKHSGMMGRNNDCDDCERGTYTDIEDEITCLRCPSFMTTRSRGSSSLTACVCIEGFILTSWGSCVPCWNGTFQPYLNSTECIRCNGYSYTRGTGSTYCDMCLAGSSMVAGSLCAPCRPGTYQATNGSTVCLLCPNNSYTPNTGSTACIQCLPDQTTTGRGSQSCVACPLNSFTSENSKCRCQQGMVMDMSSETCIACEPGKYQQDATSTLCTLCPMGSFSASEATFGGCTFCKNDTFNTCGGMSFCEKCPPHSSTRGLLGSISCKCNSGYVSSGSGCLPCEVGKYGMIDNFTCTPCERGKYNPTPGSSACLACDIATFAFFDGSSACTICVNNSMGSNEKQRCVCPPGFFNDTMSCVPCRSNCSNPGQYLQLKCYDGNDNSCLPCAVECPNNFYISRECSGSLNILCRPCARDCVKGFYRNKECGIRNNLECLPCRKTCPVGYIRTELCLTRDYQCKACEVGKYPDPYVQMSCIACPAKHYIHFNGSGYECKTCTGNFLLSANQTGCYESKCAPGEYPSMKNECSFCPLNTYGVDGRSCLVCPPFYNCERQKVGLSACVPCETQLDVGGIQTVEKNTCPVN